MLLAPELKNLQLFPLVQLLTSKVKPEINVHFWAVTTDSNQNILISDVKIISDIGEVVTKLSSNPEESEFAATQ